MTNYSSPTAPRRPLRWSRLLATVVVLGVGVTGAGISPAPAAATATMATSTYGQFNLVAVGSPVVHRYKQNFSEATAGAVLGTVYNTSREQTYYLQNDALDQWGGGGYLCIDTTVTKTDISRLQNANSQAVLNAGLDSSLAATVAEIDDTEAFTASYDARSNETRSVTQYMGRCNGNIDVVDRDGRALWGNPSLRNNVAKASSLVAAALATIGVYALVASYAPGFLTARPHVTAGFAGCVAGILATLVYNLISRTGTMWSTVATTAAACVAGFVLGYVVDFAKAQLKALAAASVANSAAEGAMARGAGFGALPSTLARSAVDSVLDNVGQALSATSIMTGTIP